MGDMSREGQPRPQYSQPQSSQPQSSQPQSSQPEGQASGRSAVDADPVDLLVSGMEPTRVELSRRVTTALRLLASDGGGHDSSSMRVHPASAQMEYERHELRRVEQDLESVATHVFRTLIHRDSMVWVPTPTMGYSESWASLLRLTTEKRRRDLGLGVPDPRKGAIDVLGGLLGSLAAVRGAEPTAATEARGRLWAARLELAGSWSRVPGHRPCLAPPAYAEIQEQLTEARRRLVASQVAKRATAEGVRVLREIISSQLAIALDARRSADVADLTEGLSGGPSLLGECRDGADAVTLFARWFVGEVDVLPPLTEERAQELGLGAGAWIERSAWESSGELPGIEAQVVASGARAGEVDRRLIGARGIVICSIDGRSGSATVVQHSVAPALNGHVDAWCRGRRYAVGEAGAPEHEAVRSGRIFVTSSTSEAASTVDSKTLWGPARSVALGGDADIPAPRSLVVEPVLEDDGRASGYVWIEADHGLFPSLEQRTALVAAARRAIAGSRESNGVAPMARGAPGGIGSTGGPTVHAHGPDSELQARWERTVTHLRIKLAERRWAAFHPGHPEGAPPRAVATGGDGELGALRSAVAAAVVRCFQTGGIVRHGASSGADPRGDAGRSMQFDEGVSGVVLPVRFQGEVLGVLCVESTRRGDPRDKDVERWEESLVEQAAGVLAARLDEADRLARRGGVALDPSDPAAQAWLARVDRLGSSSVDVLVYGEPGSGRATTARALAHRRSMSSDTGQLHPFAAAGLSPDRLEASLLDDPDDIVLITDAQRASGPLGDRLSSLAREGAGGRARIVMTSTAEEGGALARSLGLAAYQTTPLRGRRQWIPSMAEGLLRRAAWREGVDAPVLADDAVAQLWRQDWHGNASELASVLNTALCGGGGAGEPVSLDAVLAAMFECHVEPVTKRASRDPVPVEFGSALWLTRTASARINKSRAALYLGWDPATVSTKMAALGIETPKDARAILE